MTVEPAGWSHHVSSSSSSFSPAVLSFHFRSRSFLYHQIRNMMGCLIQIGRGTWSLEYLDALLSVDSSRAAVDEMYRAEYLRQRREVGNFQAPPQGLFLQQVDYPYDLKEWRYTIPIEGTSSDTEQK